MTRDELLARLVAIADERPFALIGYVVEHELPELRARAESINGAAQGMAARTVADTSQEEVPAAAPPSAQPVAVVLENQAIAWLPPVYHTHTPAGTHLYTAPPDLAARVAELEAVLRDAVTLVSIINQSEIVRSGYSLSLERAFRAALAKEKT